MTGAQEVRLLIAIVSFMVACVALARVWRPDFHLVQRYSTVTLSLYAYAIFATQLAAWNHPLNTNTLFVAIATISGVVYTIACFQLDGGLRAKR